MNTDEGFDSLLRRIKHERGLDCHQYKANFLKRRLAVRMRARGVESYREYARLLDDEEYERLFDALTINLSFFFRDRTAFEALRDKVLRPLIRQKAGRGNRLIRVWSVGCASGQEPYSVAILFDELLGDELHDWQIRIHATDLDATAIEKAKRGVYRESSFRGADPVYTERYFTAVSPGEYAISPKVAAMVKFARHNLIGDPLARRLDLILCRNVLIYFSRELQEKLLSRFHSALNDEGCLVMGKTEILMGAAARLFKPLDLRERIYVKATV